VVSIISWTVLPDFLPSLLVDNGELQPVPIIILFPTAGALPNVLIGDLLSLKLALFKLLNVIRILLGDLIAPLDWPGALSHDLLVPELFEVLGLGLEFL